MFLKRVVQTIAGGLLLSASLAASAQNVICYNCPPEWADWATQIKTIKEKTGITVPPDNKNSGQALAQIMPATSSENTSPTELHRARSSASITGRPEM